jgi:lipopolysaccharide/colanic/teichoic acid biosynthesis glycosyltransferase
MVEDAAEHGSSITSKGDSRITRLGRWLRNTKLDELPQLINVLVGQMSLVGPRPEIPKFTKGYSERFRRVLLVRPGITGRAANAYIREEELLEGCGEKERFYAAEVLPRKLELELPYCEDIRFATDVKLIAQTIGSIFAQETSSSPRYNENVFAK